VMGVPSDRNRSAPGGREGGLGLSSRIRHRLFMGGIVPRLDIGRTAGMAVLA
jgi:hypothetical protein